MILFSRRPEAGFEASVVARLAADGWVRAGVVARDTGIPVEDVWLWLGRAHLRGLVRRRFLGGGRYEWRLPG